jgi:hypothetical protein
MNFFRNKPRTPPELVRGLREAIPRLEQGPPGGEVRRRAHEDVMKNLQAIKGVLLGDGGECFSCAFVSLVMGVLYPLSSPCRAIFSCLCLSIFISIFFTCSSDTDHLSLPSFF